MDEMPTTTEWIHKPKDALGDPVWENYTDEEYEWVDSDFKKMFVADDGKDDLKRVFTLECKELPLSHTAQLYHRDIYVLTADDASLQTIEPEYILHKSDMVSNYEDFKQYSKQKRKLKAAMKDDDLDTVKELMTFKGYILLLDKLFETTEKTEQVTHPLEAGMSFSVNTDNMLKMSGSALLLVVDREKIDK